MKQTSLCYIEYNGKYLMMHRTGKSNDENSGKWIGVGGKFEEGESPEDCMKREVFEETGIRVCDWSYKAVVTFVSDVYETEHMHLFTAHTDSECFMPCDEGRLECIAKEDVMSLNLWEGDRIFLEYITDEEMPFFSLKLVYEGDALKSAVLNGREDVLKNGNV